VRGRIEVIRKFGAMIQAKVPEKPDMQDFVRDRRRLMNPQRDGLQHERSLDKKRGRVRPIRVRHIAS